MKEESENKWIIDQADDYLIVHRLHTAIIEEREAAKAEERWTQ